MVVACARCQARRSGSTSGSVACASARCTSWRSLIDAVPYTADRTNGCRKRTRLPKSTKPDATAGPAASGSTPSCRAARHTSTGSPTGSVAAMSNSRRDDAGSGASRRMKLASIRPDSGPATATPNPPASSAPVIPRGSSNRANGFPRASATSWARTCSSIRPRITEANSWRASASASPCTCSVGRLANSSLDARAAKTRPTRSASSRRAASPSACIDARSSHCTSSMRQSKGSSSPTAARRLKTAKPTKNRSGGPLSRRPNAARNASRCGAGTRSNRSSSGAHSRCRPAYGSSISDSIPLARTTRHPAA